MGLSVAELTVESLIANGIDTLYCLPGVQNDPFFNALYDRTGSLHPVQTRHEQGAAYMALGAALATGRPQAVCLVPGPGFLNGCAALCTAYALNAPVFAIIGQIPSQAIGKGFGLLHEINGQAEIMAQLTKMTIGLRRAEDAPAAFAEAWQALKSGRPGPVGIEIPTDLWNADSGATHEGLAIEPMPTTPANEASITKAAAMITASQRPLIAVGSGAQDHSDAVRSFAATIGAGVMAFRTGHGVVDETGPDFISMPQAHALWPECDLVIGLGTRLSAQKMGWGVDDGLQILHVDIDPDVPDIGPPATLKITADLGDVLPRLTASVTGSQPDRSKWQAQIDEAKARVSASIGQQLAPQLEWLAAIRAALPDDGLFVDELTQIGYVSRFAFPARHPRTFLSTGYQGTLGWGLPSALGAAHARRDVPVVAITGDGGAMFGIAELATAALHQIPLTVIVMNDNAFGNVRGIQRDNFEGRFIASDLSSPDFVALAESCGVAGARVETPAALQAALEDAILNPGPNLIEVPVGEFPSPWRYIMLPKNRGMG